MCPLIVDTILIALPSMVESRWKSVAHNTFGASTTTGRGRGRLTRWVACAARACRPSSRRSR